MTGEITLPRPRPSDRRPEGEGAGGASRRDHPRDRTGAEREDLEEILATRPGRCASRW